MLSGYFRSCCSPFRFGYFRVRFFFGALLFSPSFFLSDKSQNFECYHCGTYHLQWVGRCSQCGEWNSLKPVEPVAVSTLNAEPAEVRSLERIDPDEARRRWASEVNEFDRVLGGGIPSGSVGVIGGEPGIGKSTLVLQLIAKYASLGAKTLYVSGEESVFQIKDRAMRLDVKQDRVNVMTETLLEKALSGLRSFSPDLVFVDSVQTMKTETLSAQAGSVSQVKEVCALLTEYAKTANVAVVLVGHVNKEGHLAGPKTMEHMVDYAVYLDGEKNSSARILRAVKNRFGSLDEIGLFKMTGRGLAESKSGNRDFLERFDGERHGTAVFPSREGSRLVLLEVQALVSEKSSEYFTRTALGIERNRLLMLTAILEKYLGVRLHGKDLYVNIGGGFRSHLPAIDMAVVAAVLSSYHKTALGKGSAFVGEAALTGEFRFPAFFEPPFSELERCGFRRLFLPSSQDKKNRETSRLDLPLAGNVVDLSRTLFGRSA